jgi:RNA polymerase sigma factor (TIGR02999 family)
MSQNADVTRLLAEWSGGNREALDTLMPLVMNELKRIAGAYLSREAHAQTLQTTALVNEAYLRLVDVQPDGWENRTQFFALAAQIMRRILVDHARAQLAAKRGGGRQHLPLDSPLAVTPEAIQGVTRLDEALLDLEKLDARKSRIAELRVFGGRSHAEIAHVLGVSERTVIREWQFSKAWLGRELNYSVGDE